MNTLIAIIGLGVLCLVFEILNLRKAIVPVTIIGLLAVLGLNISEFGSTESYYGNMIVVSKYSTAFSSLFIVSLSPVEISQTYLIRARFQPLGISFNHSIPESL